MTYANNLDPDEVPQNLGLHLRSKLFDIQIIYQPKKWVETMNFLKILKETNIWKNYPACKEIIKAWMRKNNCNTFTTIKDNSLPKNMLVLLIGFLCFCNCSPCTTTHFAISFCWISRNNIFFIHGNFNPLLLCWDTVLNLSKLKK